MAVEIATAYVTILPSARNFGRNLSNELDGQMASAGASAGDTAATAFGKRLTVGIAVAATAAAAGLTAIGKAAAGYGLKIASQNEQAAISFETLLGSADKANALIEQMKQFAAETPFEFPQLQQAATSLLTTGVAAEKILPIMRTLGDVTSGMGTGAEGIQRATIALQQMNAAGRISAEDLWQLRDAGIPVFDLLTAATGKTNEELSYMAQNGKLGRKELEQLMAALESGKGLEKFNGLMQKQSQSLLGLISTLKDNLGQGLAAAMAPAVVTIKAQLPLISQTIADGLKVIGPILTDVTGELISIVARLIPIVTPFLQVLGGLFADALRAVGNIVVEFAPFFAFLAEVLANEIGGAIVELLPDLQGLLRALGPLVVLAVRLAITLVHALAPAIAALLQAVTPLASALATGLSKAFDQLANMDVSRIFSDLVIVIVQVSDALMPLVAIFVDFANQVGAAIVDMLPSMITAFAQLALAFLPIIPDITNLARDLLPVLIQSFRDLAPDAIRLAAVMIPLMHEIFRLRLMWEDLLLRVLIPFLPIILHLAEVVLPLLERVVVPIVETLMHWVEVLSQSKTGVVLLGAALGGLAILKLAIHFVLATIQGYNLLTVLTLINAALVGQAAASEAAAAAAEEGRAISAFEQLRVGIMAAAKSSFVLKAAMFALNIVMSPWFYIPVLIAAVAAAFILAYKDIQPFHDLVDSIWQSFQAGLDVVREFIGFIVGGEFGKADDLLYNIGQSILNGLVNIGGTLKEKAGEWAIAVLDGLANLGTAIANWIVTTAVPAVAAAARGLLNALIWWVTDVVPHVALGLARLWLYLQRFIYTIMVPWLVQAGWNLLVAFIGWIKEAVPAALEALVGFLQSIGPWITGTAVPWLVENTVALKDALLSWLSEAVPAALAALGGWLSAIGDWITTTALPAIVAAASWLGSALLSFLENIAVPALVALGRFLATVVGWIITEGVPALARAAWWLGSAIVSFLQELPDRIISGVPALFEALVGFVQAGIGFLIEQAPVWAAALGEWVSVLWGWVSEAVGPLLSKLGEWLGALGGWITGTALPAIGNKAAELGGALLGWLGEIIPQIPGKLGAFLQAIGVWVAEDAIPFLISAGLSLLVTALLWLAKLVIDGPRYLQDFLVTLGTWAIGAIAWLAVTSYNLFTAFIDWLTRLPNAVTDWLGKVLGNLASWLFGSALPWIIEHVIALHDALVQWVIDAALSLPGLLAGLVAQLWAWLQIAVPWVLEKVHDLEVAILSWIVNAVKAAPGKLAEWEAALLGWIKELPGKIADVAKNMFVGLTNAFIAAVNWIIRTWNAIEISVGEVEIGGVKVGGFTLGTPDVDEIPAITGFAKGGRPPTDRPSIVGELGPELFWPDRPGTIVPNSALAAPSNGGLNIGKVEVSGQDRPAETAFSIRSELAWLSMVAAGT